MADERGFVQIYTGNGKGKTTAAIGAVVRAAGHGKRCYIGQFMKGILYGEVSFLKDHNLIDIVLYGDIDCVSKSEVNDKHIKLAEDGLYKADKIIKSGNYDLVVLDEINVAIDFGLLKTDTVTGLIKEKPANIEIILTGRYAPEELIQIADLVTEMNEIKHYYKKGILSRQGFDR